MTITFYRCLYQSLFIVVPRFAIESHQIDVESLSSSRSLISLEFYSGFEALSQVQHELCPLSTKRHHRILNRVNVPYPPGPSATKSLYAPRTIIRNDGHHEASLDRALD